ncbi:hypothetical protein GGF43_005137, partial [Coemansia sp. RSA 2618]
MCEPTKEIDEVEPTKEIERGEHTEGQHDSHNQSDSSSEDEEIFVAEADYMQLSDGNEGNLDDSTHQPEAANSGLDDAFECHDLDPAASTIPQRIPVDLERAIDERLFSELEEKHSPALKQEAAQESAAGSDKPKVQYSNAAPRPVKVDVSSSGPRMSAEQVDHIKSIMAGIRLSDDAIPDWAKRVPE